MRYEKLPIKEIELDKSNPRISQYLKMYPNVSQDSLYLALGAGESSSSDTGTTFFIALKESMPAI